MDESEPRDTRGRLPRRVNEAGARVSSARFEDEEVCAFCVPLPEVRYPEGTTEAEREVIDLLLDGNALEEIAQLRGTSVRTVTTQLAEIYRKADVRSSRQLAAFTTGVDGPWTA
jgi:DNA-binding CsgD family transcriptional regulator